MTKEHQEILSRINTYAEKALAGIDPQKTQVSVQLDKLRPIMEEIAKEQNMDIEEFFILYMDLASEASITSQAKLKEEFADLELGNDKPFLFR